MSEFSKVKVNPSIPHEVIGNGRRVIANCFGFSKRDGGNLDARRIAAALNATRHIPLEQLESEDPLGYAEMCRKQREACIARFEKLPNGEYHPSAISRMIRDTPAPAKASRIAIIQGCAAHLITFGQMPR